MRLQLPDPRLELDGERLACRLWLACAGEQLTLSSLLPALAVELHSSYLGCRCGDTAVAHLLVARAQRPRGGWALRHAGGLALRLSEMRRGCLYDHLARLQRAIAAEAGGAARIELDERALELVDGA